jgi:hypothetical protein
MCADDQHVGWQPLGLARNLFGRIAGCHDHFYVLLRRCEERRAESSHLVGDVIGIDVEEDRNSPRHAFNRERSRGLVDVKQGELRRVPLGQHPTVSQCVE